MYQALYRKYRPRNFNEVVGQNVIVKTLTNSLKNKNISHAYLFTGPRGTGKTSIAKILAQSVNCENLKDGISCGVCVNCTQSIDKSHIDIIEIDAASNNGVDEIRELKNKINLVPTIGKYKIYIIDEVHMLTTGAFNALLKTLEEPPKHVIFILATTEPQKIPSTILSRCQRYDFKRISNNAISNRLKEICKLENIDINDECINEIARLSDGGMRDSLSILDQVSAFSQNKVTMEDIHLINGTLTQNELADFVNKIIDRDLYSILNIIDRWDETGKNYQKIIEELIIFIKNILICQEAKKYLQEININIEPFESLKNKINKNEAINIIDILNSGSKDIKKSNVPKLFFEILLFKLIGMKDLEKNASPSIESKNEEKRESLSSIIKENKDIQINKELKEKIKKLKDIRINNTLAHFDKRELLDLKQKEDDLKPLLIDLDYSKYASIILDGTLKAASDDHLIYIFDTESASDLFNENITKIQETLYKVYNKKYKVISDDIISWEIIRKDFNSKIKKYSLIDEGNLENNLYNEKNLNKIEELFQNSIEYK